ncbi:MAG: cytochrome c3 family protein, partial [Pirellulaceae bacterium]|nr:cytochrome c3 family protein [Pirellulaceae bacterium]
MACTVLSLAALLVMLSRACWTEAFAPGALTLKHAQILSKNSTSNRCAACHEAGDKSVGDWALHMVGAGSLQTPQSALCLKCHEKGLDSAHALLPHGVSRERLAKHTLEVAGEGGESSSKSWTSVVSIPENEQGEIGCAACHREHHGKEQDLATMSNQQCQACHAKTFHSFASGHPEFTQWPFEKRSPIAFDHAGHNAKHFPAGKQAFRCETCHVDGARRDVKLLAGFQTACASCHEPKIKQSGEQGFQLFALPGMNVEALAAAGHSIGEWPEGISNDFDGVIPPAMALLLSADEQTAKALAKIPQGDLSAVDATNKEQLSAAAEVALGSKRLLHEFATEGEAAFTRKMNLNTPEASQLWAHLPPDVLRAAQTAWLPKLAEEMALLREGHPLPPHRAASFPSAVIQEPKSAVTQPTEGDDDLLGGAAEPKPPEALTRSSSQPTPNGSSPGWQRSDASYSIAWRPSGHADPLLKAWIELSLIGIIKASFATTALRAFHTKPTSIGYCAPCHNFDRHDSSA